MNKKRKIIFFIITPVILISLVCMALPSLITAHVDGSYNIGIYFQGIDANSISEVLYYAERKKDILQFALERCRDSLKPAEKEENGAFLISRVWFGYKEGLFGMYDYFQLQYLLLLITTEQGKKYYAIVDIPDLRETIDTDINRKITVDFSELKEYKARS